MEYDREREYVGNMDQLLFLQESRLVGGKADGIRMVRVKNGSGMELDVLADRGMDIPYFGWKGKNVGYLTPAGIVAPAYHEPDGNGFLHSFTGGFLTTCGLKNVGNAGEYQGNSYGMHGKLSHTPVKELGYTIKREGNKPTAVIRGKLQEGSLFEDVLSMERTIRCGYKDKTIFIRDVVENQGFSRAQHMILYHFNFGYPLLDEDALLYLPAENTFPRNKDAEDGLKDWDKIETPGIGYREQCFYHQICANSDGIGRVGLYQPKLDFGVGIQFDTRVLSHFVQWKMMGKGEYVMGLEPCSSTIDGVEDAWEKQTVKVLEPGEAVVYRIGITVIEGLDEFEQYKKGEFYEQMVSG